MGTRITAKGVYAEDYALEYSPPVRRGLEAWHFLNTSAAKGARNYAPGKPQARIVGTPGENAAFLQFKGERDFIQTEVAESAGHTFFFVARSSDTLADIDTRPMFYGTYRSPAADGSGETFGVGAWVHAPGQINQSGTRGNSNADDTSWGAALTNNDVATWALYVGIVDPGMQPHRLMNKTKGTQAATVVPTMPRFLSTGRYRIGSGYGGTGYTAYKGTCEMALWACYSQVLTGTEIDAVVANVRAYMARRGITV